MQIFKQTSKANSEQVLGPLLLPSSQAGLGAMPSGGTEKTPKEA